jgi:hypothetical protein
VCSFYCPVPPPPSSIETGLPYMRAVTRNCRERCTLRKLAGSNPDSYTSTVCVVMGDLLKTALSYSGHPLVNVSKIKILSILYTMLFIHCLYTRNIRFLFLFLFLIHGQSVLLVYNTPGSQSYRYITPGSQGPKIERKSCQCIIHQAVSLAGV